MPAPAARRPTTGLHKSAQGEALGTMANTATRSEGTPQNRTLKPHCQSTLIRIYPIPKTPKRPTIRLLPSEQQDQRRSSKLAPGTELVEVYPKLSQRDS